MITFEEFKKIPRLFRDCTITEKIDGTNGQIVIQPSILGGRGQQRTAGRRDCRWRRVLRLGWLAQPMGLPRREPRQQRLGAVGV